MAAGLGGPGHFGHERLRRPQKAHLLSPWGQLAVFAVYTALLLIVGAILFRKRDA